MTHQMYTRYTLAVSYDTPKITLGGGYVWPVTPAIWLEILNGRK